MDKVKEVLEKYGTDTIATMVSILNSKGSKNLQNKIEKEIIEDAEYVSLKISMPAYARFTDVQRGAGLLPPSRLISDWAKSRGIPETAVYPIRLNIARGQIKDKGKHFLKVFFEGYPEIKQELNQALIEDYKKILDYTISQSLK